MYNIANDSVLYRKSYSNGNNSISSAVQFLSEPQHLECYLVANPFKKNSIEGLNPKISKHLEVINLLIDQDKTIIKKKDEFQTEKIIYFLLIKDYLEKKTDSTFINKSRAQYLIKVLDTVRVDKISEYLYDKLFAISNPALFNKIQKFIYNSQQVTENYKEKFENNLQSILRSNNIDAEVNGRVKTIHSISKKITNKNLLLSQLNDIIGIRVITNDKESCYTLLGLILTKFEIINDALKDYISYPKKNGYQSIHISIKFDEYPIEIQIRSKDMHDFAEYGRAAHATYKKANPNEAML